MMKNCGENVHFEVVDQHILQEMVKIVQKRVLSSSLLQLSLFTCLFKFAKRSNNSWMMEDIYQFSKF